MHLSGILYGIRTSAAMRDVHHARQALLLAGGDQHFVDPPARPLDCMAPPTAPQVGVISKSSLWNTSLHIILPVHLPVRGQLERDGQF